MLLLGSHVSFTKDKQLLGSVLETISYDGNTFMIYTGAPQNTLRNKIDDRFTQEAYQLMAQHHISNIVVHAPYLINLATTKNREFALNFLKQEIKRTLQLGITKIILHPGSHVGIREVEAIEKIASGLNEVMTDNNIIICLESMSKKGTEIGTIDELASIYDKCLYQDRIQICLDTCHLHDAGYDITDFNQIIDEVEQKIGKNKIGCLHVNDSKNPKGSCKDRHANLNDGTIGLKTIKQIVYNKRLKDVPKILETPYIKDSNGKPQPPYKAEIKMLRATE